MKTLAQKDGKDYLAVILQRGDAFVPPLSGFPFPCLIWDHDGRLSEQERVAVAKALLDADCRYVVCGGQHCEAWHDTLDIEWVAVHIDDPDDVQEAAHVMTTWHNGETPDEVAFFFVLTTNFDSHDFKRYLVVHVGSGPAVEQLETAIKKYAVGDAAV